MSESFYFRIPDTGTEPIGLFLDTDNAGCYLPMTRMLEIIPFFNIMLPVWKETHLQFDTVFYCLKKMHLVEQIILKTQRKDKTYINARLINPEEEIPIISIKMLKEMYEMYLKYINETQITLKSSDLSFAKEYFFEFVRKNEFIDKRGRLDSLFIYENLGLAQHLNKVYYPKNEVELCKVRVEERRSLDRYDANWFHSLDTSHVYTDYHHAARSYWSGVVSGYGMIEYLFSGKYILMQI